MVPIPIGYLISTLLYLLCIYYVLAPTTWYRPFRVLPFSKNYLGWWVVAATVNELVFFALVALAASNALAIVEGDAASPAGLVIFGFNLVAAVGLLVMFYASLRTAPVLKHALNEALGDDWTDGFNRPLVEGLDKRFSVRALAGPFFRRRSGVEHIRSISYGDANWYNTLDVYYKASRPSGSGIFIHLHGGALRSGKKDNDALPLLYHLANHGWVCISANFRLQPYASFDEQLNDVRRIIVWAKTHAADYGGDPGFVMIGGGSSGGQLAALIGLEVGYADAVVAFYGQFYYGSSEESPSTYVNEKAPPFFLMHGDHDNLVPVDGTRQFAQALRNVSKNPIVYAELPNATHNFDLLNSVRSLAIARAVEAFGTWAQHAKRAADTHPK